MSERKGISRRQFIAGAAVLGVAACGGAGALAMRSPKIEFKETSCGQQAGSQGKVLVAYASQFGSTGEVAAAITETLCSAGVAADVKLAAHVGDLSAYRAVIVGAPVHSSKWMEEATDFVAANRAALGKLPVAYFLTCMTLAATNRPEQVQKIAGILNKVQDDIPEVVPVAQGAFAGALEYDRMSFLYRVIYQILTPNLTAGDFRDWAAIRAWAESVRPKLVEQS